MALGSSRQKAPRVKWLGPSCDGSRSKRCLNSLYREGLAFNNDDAYTAAWKVQKLEHPRNPHFGSVVLVKVFVLLGRAFFFFRKTLWAHLSSSLTSHGWSRSILNWLNVLKNIVRHGNGWERRLRTVHSPSAWGQATLRSLLISRGPCQEAVESLSNPCQETALLKCNVSGRNNPPQQIDRKRSLAMHGILGLPLVFQH